MNTMISLFTRAGQPASRSAMRGIGANSLWLLLARLITQLQLVAFSVLVARTLGVAGFGQYAFVAAMIVTGNVVTTFGTDTLLIREVARARTAAAAFSAAALQVQLALSAVWIIAVLLGGDYFGSSSAEVALSLKVYSLSLVPLAFFTVFTSLLRAHERMDLYLLLNALVAALQLGAAWLVLNRDGRLLPLIVVLTAVQSVAALLAGSICRRVVPAFKFDWRIARDQLKHVIRLAWPLALLSVLAVLYQRSGIWALSAFGNETQTGLFSAAARVIESMKLIHLAVLGVLLPALSRLGIRSEVGVRLFKRSLGLLMAVGAAAALVVVIGAQTIVGWFYGASYSEAIVILQVLALSLIPYSLSANFAVRLVVQQREQTLAQITAISLVIALLLNAWLVASYGALGAAWAFVVAEGCQAGALLLTRR